MTGTRDSHAPVVTIDGPGGSGKGTISQALAAHLGWHYLDSGSLYRLLAYAALRERVALDDDRSLVALAARLDATCRLPQAGDPAVLLDGHDVSRELRTEAAGDAASRIAALPAVREALLDWQRHCRRPPGLVADGRDMGTVVFPDAECKIFLTASPRVRAERRYNQLIKMGKEADMAALLAEVEARDRRDSERATAPLRPAEDAFILDNSRFDEARTLAAVLDVVHKKL
jgi:cytidylate kinase